MGMEAYGIRQAGRSRFFVFASIAKFACSVAGMPREASAQFGKRRHVRAMVLMP
jgi:hypothetical protein